MSEGPTAEAITADKHRAIAALTCALYETIRDIPEGVPAGVLYSYCTQLLDLSLADFEAIMDAIVKTGRVTLANHIYKHR